MFRCPLCGRVVPARVPAVRVVLETRAVTYPSRERANRPIPRFIHGKWRRVRPDDPGGHGREIVRETLACAACAARVGG